MNAPWIENVGAAGPFAVVTSDTLTLHDSIDSARLHLAALLYGGNEESGCTGYGPEPVCDLCEEPFTEDNPEGGYGCCARCWSENIDIDTNEETV